MPSQPSSAPQGSRSDASCNGAVTRQGRHGSSGQQVGRDCDAPPAQRSSVAPQARRTSRAVRDAHRQQNQSQRSSAPVAGLGAAVRDRGSSQPKDSQEALARLKLLSPRKKVSTSKRVLIGVGVFIALILCVGIGYTVWYSGELNDRLALGDAQASDVNAALAPGNIDEPFYMLILGSDSREGSGTSTKEAESGDNQRSDVMILMRVDASNKKITMVSIPRDTRYKLPNGSVVKLNEAYNIGGAAASIEAVSKLTGVPISHYAEVHFSEFQKLVDKLGGITVNVPVEISYIDALTGETVSVAAGEQTLNGQQAQIFARARHEYETSQDENRQSNVRHIAAAIMEKVLATPLYDLPNTVLDVATCVGTDLKAEDIVNLAVGFAGGSGKPTMYSCTGPSSGAVDESAGGIWLCYENPEGWARLLAVVDSGEDPSNLDVESTAIISVSDESS